MALIDGYLGYLDIGGGLKSQWRLRIFAIFFHSIWKKISQFKIFHIFQLGWNQHMDKLSSNKLTAKACTQKMVVGRQVFPIAAAVRFRECRIYWVWEHCGISWSEFTISFAYIIHNPLDFWIPGWILFSWLIGPWWSCLSILSRNLIWSSSKVSTFCGYVIVWSSWL